MNWLGRRAVEFPAHIYRVQRSRQPRDLQCEPAVDHCRGVDPRNDGLRQVPQWAWGRLALRRISLGLDTRRQLHGTDRVRLVVQLELQDFPPTDMGSAGETFFNAALSLVVSSRADWRARYAQVITYEKASGWIMWTWKAEQADEWSYQAGLRYGWIPSDPTSLEYPNICG